MTASLLEEKIKVNWIWGFPHDSKSITCLEKKSLLQEHTMEVPMPSEDS